MIPIHHIEHWILVAVSIPLQVIKICDSILRDSPSTYDLPPHCLRDIEKYLNYYYPDRKGKWTHEHLLKEERFQDELFQIDCGYHILNFSEAAISNKRIHQKGNEFIKYKRHVCDVMTKLDAKKDASNSSEDCNP